MLFCPIHCKIYKINVEKTRFVLQLILILLYIASSSSISLSILFKFAQAAVVFAFAAILTYISKSGRKGFFKKNITGAVI